MSNITPEHLARQAVVYIRQSTPDQVVHHLESKRRHIGAGIITKLGIRGSVW
jgi:hypothetical protein